VSGPVLVHTTLSLSRATSVHLSFPNATRVLCAKHLKDNAIVNLGKSLRQPEVTKIITKLFGESGILASEDQVTIDEIRENDK
jgi:hypothetical protein